MGIPWFGTKRKKFVVLKKRKRNSVLENEKNYAEGLPFGSLYFFLINGICPCVSKKEKIKFSSNFKHYFQNM